MPLALITERGKTHGRFEDNARIAQGLRAFWREQAGWSSMPDVQREALDLIALKLSRILSGQATHYDHWRDVQGYGLLAEQACPQPALAPIGHPGVCDGNGWHPQVDS